MLRGLDEWGGPAPSARESAALERFYNQAFSLMTSGEGRRVFDLEREPARVRDRYGRGRFGQSCLLARRLVEAGVPFVQVNWSQHVEAEEDAGDGGWDNHYRNFEMLADRQAWPFDQACAALLDDLSERGMLRDTLVVAMGEFGRTPKINAQARPFWPAAVSRAARSSAPATTAASTPPPVPLPPPTSAPRCSKRSGSPARTSSPSASLWMAR
jgi:hypothetical protein